MKNTLGLSLVVAGMLVVWASVAPIDVQTQQKPIVPLPEPGVPEIMTMEGTFVRAVYNNEGYVILGYEPVQPVHRRAVGAPRHRRHCARLGAGLQADARRTVPRDA